MAIDICVTEVVPVQDRHLTPSLPCGELPSQAHLAEASLWAVIADKVLAS